MSDMNPPTNDIGPNSRPGVESFGNVSQYSETTDQDIREALAAMEKIPASELITLKRSSLDALLENYANTRVIEELIKIRGIDDETIFKGAADNYIERLGDVIVALDQRIASLTADTGPSKDYLIQQIDEAIRRKDTGEGK